MPQTTYVSNELNQYLAKANRAIAVSGTVESARIAVAGGSTDRQGRFWNSELSVNNSSGPWRGPISIYAAGTDAGGNSTGFVRVESRMAQIAPMNQKFTYDLDGNMTDDGVWAYSYDAENRLITMTTTTAAIIGGYSNRQLEFKYDYLGRRVQKRSINFTANTDTTNRYLYDGWNLIAEFSVTSTSTLNLIRSYTWGLDIARSLTDAGGVGALLQIHDYSLNKDYFPSYDGNGNIAALFDASSAGGTCVAKYEYSPYGEFLRCEGDYAKENPFRFSTKFTDDETGLVYYGHRYYSPSLGRFINRDPIEEQGGLNLYGFCGNNSVNRWDYLGNVTVNDIWEPGPSDDAVMAQLHPTWVQKGEWDYYDPGSDTETIWHGWNPSDSGEGSLDDLTQGGFKLMASDIAATAAWRAGNEAYINVISATQPVASFGSSEMVPENWTGRIVKSKPETRSTKCPRNDDSTVLS